jgi:hypothetical protein
MRTELATATDFWEVMVEPDFAECKGDPTNLRAALHAASSLFHMHDWVWLSHRSAVELTFPTFVGKTGAPETVTNASRFANALEDQYPDFSRIRGVANAGKHLQLTKPRKGVIRDAHAPVVATKTKTAPAVGVGGYGAEIGYGAYGAYGVSPRVIIAGADGTTSMDFLRVALSTHEMWLALRTTLGW